MPCNLARSTLPAKHAPKVFADERPSRTSLHAPRASDAACVGPQGIASIAKLTSLTALALCDCNAVTGNGLGVLAALTRLVSLSVVRCDKVVACGFAGIMALPRLALLDVYGCVKARQRCNRSADAYLLMHGCQACDSDGLHAEHSSRSRWS